MQLLPLRVPRDEYNDAAGRIGNAWLNNGRLYCSAYIPSGAYWPIPAYLSTGKFVEFTLRVKNLRNNKAYTDSIGLDFEHTRLEDAEEIDLPATSVCVESC